MFYVYTLQSLKYSDQIYVGSTNDLKKRFREHNDGKIFSTKRYVPWKLIYYEAYTSDKLAHMREKQLKHHGNAMNGLKKRIIDKLIMKNSAGFSFVEIIVVIGILFTLFGIASLSLVSTRSDVSLDTTASSLITDLASQQIKSMTGDTEGRATNDTYGVHFEQDKYILFHGLSYSPSDSSNFTIPIKEPVRISSIQLPASSIVFSLRSGQVNGFSSLQNSITLQDSVTGKQKTVIINRYGVVTSAN